MRLSSEQDRKALKSYTRKLIRLCGSIDAIVANEVTRVRKSNLSDYQNPNRPWFAPVDTILDLELDAHDPVVARWLARRQGYELMPVTFDPDCEDRITRSLAKIGKEVGEVFARVHAALADDNVITKKEVPAIVNELDDAIAALAEAKGLMQAIEAGTYQQNAGHDAHE